MSLNLKVWKGALLTPYVGLIREIGYYGASWTIPVKEYDLKVAGIVDFRGGNETNAGTPKAQLDLIQHQIGLYLFEESS